MGKRRLPPRVKSGKNKGQFKKRKGAKRKKRGRRRVGRPRKRNERRKAILIIAGRINEFY